MGGRRGRVEGCCITDERPSAQKDAGKPLDYISESSCGLVCQGCICQHCGHLTS